MANYLSKRAMRLMCDYKWCELSNRQKLKIQKHERKQLGCYCKYNYTSYALYKTIIGLVLVESYNEYCELLTSYDVAIKKLKRQG